MISTESLGAREMGGPIAERPSLRTVDPALLRTYDVGRSCEGRPLTVTLRGPEHGTLRILAIAGQHGDEPWGRQATRQWIASSSRSEHEETGPGELTRMALLDANPDGASLGCRTNAQGADLNRDHLYLRTPEVRAIHETVRRFRPHLIVDVHNYPARRRHLLSRGWTIGADIQLAGATHPAIRTSITSSDFEALYHRVASELESNGYSVAPYTLFRRSGEARPSTLRVRDARNSLALRYGVPTVLLEGRDPGRRGEREEYSRTVTAQRLALRSIESWARENHAQLVRGPPVLETGGSLPTRVRWEGDGSPRTLAFRRPGSTEIVAVDWARYTGKVVVRAEAQLPRAYAVRLDRTELRAVLDRHDVAGDRVESPRWALVEPVGPVGSGPDGPKGPSPPAAPQVLDLAGYVVYTVHQRAGRALALWLEAGPKFGMARLIDAAEGEGPETRPPVVRIVQWDYPPHRFPSLFLGRGRALSGTPVTTGPRRFPWALRSREEVERGFPAPFAQGRPLDSRS